MADSISSDEVKKIANLARLPITDEEAQVYQAQLSAIIEYFKVLDNQDLENVKITSQVTGLESITRNIDEVGNRTLAPESAVREAPIKHKNYIMVPAVLANRNDGE